MVKKIIFVVRGDSKKTLGIIRSEHKSFKTANNRAKKYFDKTILKKENPKQIRNLQILEIDRNKDKILNNWKFNTRYHRVKKKK